MEFSFDFQINGEPATWADILGRMRKASQRMSDVFSDFDKVYRAPKSAETRRVQVDDFICWLAKHQDDGMVEV